MAWCIYRARAGSAIFLSPNNDPDVAEAATAASEMLKEPTWCGHWRQWQMVDTFTDPRTGEIIKGHVTLGSLRVRQDYMIAEGLLAPYQTGKPTSPEMEKMALARLRQLLVVRKNALARVGENAISPRRPLATLEEVLVPLYLMHRYQVEAVAKSIAGVSYTYALRGDGQTPLTPVPPAEQRRALATLLGAVAPAVLEVPESVLKLIPPRPIGFERHRELFANHTAGTFDALAPAEAAAQMTFAAVLEPARCVVEGKKQARLPAQQAHLAYGAGLVAQYFEHPIDFAPPRVPSTPPGSPIGCDF